MLRTYAMHRAQIRRWLGDELGTTATIINILCSVLCSNCQSVIRLKKGRFRATVNPPSLRSHWLNLASAPMALSS